MHRPDGPAGAAARGPHLRGRPVRLTPSQRILLDWIARHPGAANWYDLGQACLGRLASPADFQLRPLLDAGLIEELARPGTPLKNLRATTEGTRALLDYATPLKQTADS